MRPTEAGTELLDALRQDDVAALMHQHAKAPASPSRPRPRRYGPRKPTRAERKLAFHSALSVRRIVITPQVCAILDVLLRAETSDLQGIEHQRDLHPLPAEPEHHLPHPQQARQRPLGEQTAGTPQSRRSRAGQGKGGPPHTWYSLTSDGHSAAVHEPNERAPGLCRDEIWRLDGDLPVNAMAFSPDGTRAATASSDGIARVWYVDRSLLIEQALGKVTKNMTRQEWSRYFHDESYRKIRADLP